MIPKMVLTPRKSEGKVEIDLDPEQLTIIKQRERNTSQVRGDCASRNTDSQSFRTGRICQNVGTWTILYYQRISHEGNKSTPRNSQNSRFQAILNDRVKIGPASGIEVFEPAGILGYRSASTVTTTMKIEVMGA